MKIFASIQPCYLPWRGYFHIIQQCDIFSFADDLPYNRHNWRNRNIIKTGNGAKWLTVPVQRKSAEKNTRICDILIDNSHLWGLSHWDLILQSYRKARFFKNYSPFFKDVYHKKWERLVDLDIYLTMHICNFLNIKTQFMRGSDLDIKEKKTARIIHECQNIGATCYLTGPSAKAYIEEERLKAADISLRYQKYDYPSYPQLYGVYVDHLSIIDLLFNCGEDSQKYIWGV